MPIKTLDTIQYKKWTDSLITINDFSWTVKPSYYDRYLLRGDQVLLSLFKQNKFQRNLYFTIGFAEDSRLSLKEYLTSLIIVDKLTPFDKTIKTQKEYKKSISKILQLSKHLNLNSLDEIRMYDNFRYDLFGQVNNLLTNNEKQKAKQLMKLLDKYGNEKQVPYSSLQGKVNLDYLRGKI